MTEKQLIQKLAELRSLPSESEVVEFKEAKNDYDFNKLGKYFSALSNEANLKGKEDAWLIFGVEDKKRSIVGSNYRSKSRSHLDSLKGEVAKKTSNRLTFIEIYELNLAEGRVVMFSIPAAPKGMPIAWDGHYYGRDGEELSPLNLEEIERIRKQATRVDWSAGICPDATIDDLDPSAIIAARENFKVKNPRLAHEVDSWDIPTFLNKAKVAINSKLTRTAIILLGKPESEHYIAPAIARITWVLKDKDNVEKDYQHFTCPFILAINEVYGKIRNLKYRYITDGTLFPDEVDQYDPFNIKEALSNCICHQDYTLGGRINVVEREDAQLIFTNQGEFLPGSVETVIESDEPPSYYRNNFLAQAMVNFNMIDTVGSGIKRMFRLQRERFFPMPDYDLQGGKVKATLIGKVLDMDFARLLAKRPDLSLDEIIMLDKVQKRKTLSDAEIKHLRDKGLIEGKRPNIIISVNVAQATGQKASYTRNKAFNKQDYFDWIIKALNDHGSLSRKDIEELLWDKLSDLYDEKQKKIKITNLISELRQKKVIVNEGSDTSSKWVLMSD
ncbi:RNA-binding domain-containing protein [Paraflavisolibacter sp. H34]|uniref:RNA-binding domain-containing protein n=1 Tax=Huijunlia imazamoxiresistens TaxID=3127457 RepID=UPI00301806F1